MRKYDSSILVCTSEQVKKLLALGVNPVGFFCYEYVQDAEFAEVDGSTGYAFAGEYDGQENAIPAWTMEELNIMIGGEIAKPDLLGKEDWTPNTNMLQYVLYLPTVSKRFFNGAQAAAAMLEFLIVNNQVTAADVNKRVIAFIEQKFYNSQNDALEKAREEKQNGSKNR